MKRHLILTSILIAGLVNAEPPTFHPDPRLAKGTFKNHVYQNDFLELTYFIPEAWTVELQLPVKTFMAPGGDAMVRDGVLRRESVRADQSHTYNLLQAVSPRADFITGYLPNISIIVEHLPEGGRITTADAYLQNAIRMFKQMTSAHYEILDPRKKLVVGGRDFVRADYRATLARPDSPTGRLSILQSQYVTVVNGYALQLILSAGTEKRMDDLRGSLEKLQFNHNESNDK